MTGAALAAVLAVGAGSALMALHAHEGQELLRARQSQSLRERAPVMAVTAASVQAVVARAPEPVLAARRTPVAWIGCRSGARAPLRNPWLCSVRYRSGTRAHYRLVVQPNGDYMGRGSGIIEGCCVATPALG
jgi:hypothetical protein